jgi:predicted DNA-binding transcriptional regulator AlpA
MTSKSNKPSTAVKTPRRKGGGYKLGPRKPPPIPDDALWLSSVQVCNRYGGRSQMWLWRHVNDDEDFPKPSYSGRLMMFRVSELDAYDRKLISKKVGDETPRKVQS